MSMFASLGKKPIDTSYPFPAWPAHIVLVVEDALRLASKSVENLLGGKAKLLAATEEQITASIQNTLHEILSDGTIVDGFTSDIFQSISRNESVEDYTGAYLDKQPDLTFKLVGQCKPHQGLYCECKILDRAHPVRNYLYDGLARFVTGKYAWAMQHAHMIGYVRDQNLTPLNLTTYLAQNNKTEGKTHSECLQIQGIPVIRPSDLVYTNHHRKFKLVRLSNTPDATPIAIRHLWLNI
ncbi:hypothetical protein ACT4XF_14035 [Acinetobacter baumannii]